MKAGIAVFAIALTACTVSPIKPLNDGMYTVTAQNYLGTSSGAHETVRALDKAEVYCRQQSKGALLRSHTEWGLPALTTLSGTIVFVCTDTTDPAYITQQSDPTAIP